MRRSVLLSLILMLACGGCLAGTTDGVAELSADSPADAACVVLLHGLGRTPMSMGSMAQALETRGYRVMNLAYPSTDASIEILTNEHLAPALQRCREAKCRVIHMVAHSLGGILIRQYLQTRDLPAGSRVVMLSPPNQGSELAEQLKPYRIYQWVTGPAGQQLGTQAGSVPRQLGPVGVPIGVITGSESWNPLFSYWIPGPDDGKVAVEGARLEEMVDFLVVPASHTFIMEDDTVIAQTIHFLRYGFFDRRHARPEDSGSRPNPAEQP